MNELLMSGGTVSVKRWKQIAATGGPEARSGHTVTTLMDNLYIHGGTITSTGLTTGELWRFNATNQTWTQLASSPTPAYLHSTVGIDGRLFSWGGKGSGTIMRIYNAANNTWSVGATVPAALGAREASCLMVKWNTTIYILGGKAPDGLATATFIKYESATNTWTTTALAVHPTNVCNGNLTLANGYFYSFGGDSGDGTIQNTQLCRYDPVANTWTVIKTGLSPRSPSSAVFLADNIIYFGGSQIEKPVMYNPFTDTLSVLDDTVPLPLQGRGMLLGNKLYRFGSDVNDNSLWVYDHYIGKAKPNYVYVDGAEFISGTKFNMAITTNAANNPTVGNDACDFIFMRALGRILMLPTRSMIMNKELQYFLGVSGNLTIAGGVWRYSQIRTTIATNDEWNQLFGSVIEGTQSTPVPRLVSFRQQVVLNNPDQWAWGWTEEQTNQYTIRGGNGSIYSNARDLWTNKTRGWRFVFEYVSGPLPW